MEPLKVGDKAPDFSAPNQHGETVSLSDFAGKKLILYFYPKDNTPGCTTESCNFRDHYQSLLAKGFEVVGVSINDGASHKRFASKYDLPFNLLVDDEKKMVNDYQVWGEKNLYGLKYMGTSRTTFIIDEKGVIEHIIRKVKNKEASQQVLDLYPGL